MSIRSYLMARFYDAFMHKTETQRFAKLRPEILKTARGTVLEIGAGTGVNLEHYPLEVEKLILSEPDPHMRKLLEARAKKLGKTADILDCPAEDISLPDNSVDTAVSTLVLCSVTDPDQVLQEIHRVLKPDGRLFFLEHVHSLDRDTKKWQRRLEPIWRFVAGNCHLTRNTEQSLAESGFTEEKWHNQILDDGLKIVSNWFYGVARNAPIQRTCSGR